MATNVLKFTKRRKPARTVPLDEQLASDIQATINRFVASAHQETDWSDMLEALRLVAYLVKDNRDGVYD